MHKNPAKDIIKPQLAGLIAGTGLIVMIQITSGFMIPVVGSYYGYVILVYSLAGLISGYLGPKLSWLLGIWLTLPWIVWIFSNIARAGFNSGIAGSIGWLLFYSFPFLPACTGAYAGAITSRWKKKLTS
jgi:hypothetical protein